MSIDVPQFRDIDYEGFQYVQFCQQAEQELTHLFYMLKNPKLDLKERKRIKTTIEEIQCQLTQNK